MSHGALLPVVVIAAAGRAKRFSGRQKVVAEVGRRPAICRVAEACDRALGPHRQVVVIGHSGAQVRAVLGEAPYRQYVTQEPQLGTGHALATAMANLEREPDREVFFVCGDKPLLSSQSLGRIREDLGTSGAAMIFLTGGLEGDVSQSRQGRVLQAHPGTPHSEVLAVVERATIDALDEGGAIGFDSLSGERHEFTRAQLLGVQEVNLSAYIWREGILRDHLDKLQLHPGKGEYYVTDLVEILREQRQLVRAVPAFIEGEGIGIDTPEQLIDANGIIERWQRWTRDSDPDAAEEASREEATDAVL